MRQIFKHCQKINLYVKQVAGKQKARGNEGCVNRSQAPWLSLVRVWMNIYLVWHPVSQWPVLHGNVPL